jgi:hypothetical protein
MEARRKLTQIAAGTVLALAAPFAADASTLRCPQDSVKVGTVCVDAWEASVWQIPPSNTSLIKRVLAGKATLVDLTAAGAVQLGCAAAPFNHTDFPATFPPSGNWSPVAGSKPPSPGVFAVSVLGVLPTACITWFQAEQACAASGKRLLTNQEWQRAAAGTPDPGSADDHTTTCATNTVGTPIKTGSRGACRSSWGAYDMVGSVWEWVADWGDYADGCTNWPAELGGDVACFGGPGSTVSNLPAATRRGGGIASGDAAGVFAGHRDDLPSDPRFDTGFRCGR